jgi:hypothetical protein
MVAVFGYKELNYLNDGYSKSDFVEDTEEHNKGEAKYSHQGIR